VRAGGGPQSMSQADRSGHTGRIANAVISSRDIIIHRFGNSQDFHSELMEVNRITQGVVATDWNQIFNTQIIQIL